MHDGESPKRRRELAPGDLCHHGANALPLYRVIWVDDGKAWLRDVNSGADSVVGLDRCRSCAEDIAIEPKGVAWPDGTPRP